MERENLDDETNNINSDTNSDPQKDSIEEYYVTRSINSDSIASSHRLWYIFYLENIYKILIF